MSSSSPHKLVKIQNDKFEDIKKSVRNLMAHDLLVGVPAENAGRTDEESRVLNNAEIAYIMEHGAPEANIPARPHLEPGLREGRDKIETQLRRGVMAALLGRSDAAMQALHAAGLAAVSAIRNKIVRGPFAPLSPSTLAKRRARGRTGEKPLIDTGAYLRAISYVIRPRKGKQ